MVRLRRGAAALACFGLLSCGAPNFVPVHNPVASVQITPANDTIDFQGSVTLEARALDLNGLPTVPSHRAVWTSLSPTILTVDTLGTVRSIWYGPGVIHVVVDGVEAQAPVVARIPPIVSVTVSPAGATPERGDTIVFHASAKNSVGLPATISGIHWVSSDTTRVRIDSTGRAVAVAIGPAQVTATVDTVTGSTGLVVLVPTASVTVTPDSFNLAFDDTITVKVQARDSAGHVLADRQIHLASSVLQTPPTLLPPDSLVTVRAVNAGAAALIASAGHVADTARGTVGTLSFRSVAPGGWFTCAVTVDSAAYCWGWGAHGELGSGDTLSGPRPRRVAGGHKFASLTAGPDFACGLTGDGSAWCWGDNTSGNLGRAGPSSTTPVSVSGGHQFSLVSGNASSFFDISFGGSCAQTAGGPAYCWGSDWGTTPVVIDSSTGFDRLSVGGGGYCGSISADSTTACWTAAAPVAMLHNLGIATDLETAPGWSTACGIATSGWYCWGSWPYVNNNFSSPPPGPLYSSQSFVQVTSGYQFLCGLTASGQVRCRGDNSLDQLGSTAPGSGFTDSLVTVATPVVFTSISAGSFHTCGFGADDRLYCWGENDLGQSGSVLQYPHNFATPQPVFGQP